MQSQNSQTPIPVEHNPNPADRLAVATPLPAAQNSAIRSNISSLGLEFQPTPEPTKPQPVMQPYSPTSPQSVAFHPAQPLSYGDLIGNTGTTTNKNIVSFMPNKALFILVGCFLAGVIVIIIALATRRTAPGAIGDVSATGNNLKNLYSLLQYGTNVSDEPTLNVMGESSLVVASTQNVLANKFSGIANAQDSTNAQINADLKNKLDKAANINDLNQAFYTELKSELASTSEDLKKLANDPGSATQQAAARNAADYFGELYNRLNSNPTPDD